MPSPPTRRLSYVSLLALTAVVFLSLPNAIVAKDDDADKQPHLESCRSDGFDPWQLSCETCALLPTSASTSTTMNMQQRCLECCQSYKTLAQMTKPYESAVLVHRDESPDSTSEMAQFLDEHWDELVTLKGKNRLVKIVRDDSSSMSSGFLFRRPPPQMLLWFDDAALADTTQKLKELKQAAKEIVYLEGYKKDDMKDMITTLLPDSKK